MLYKKEQISVEYFEEGGVFYSEKRKKFYALDEFGSEIFKYIDQLDCIHIDIIIKHFINIYNVDEAVIYKDIHMFFNNLIEYGVLSIIQGE